VILDLPRFVASERPYWDELRKLLERLEADPYTRLGVSEVNRLRYLYSRAISGLAKLTAYSDQQTQQYLEGLVARAYTQCHPNRARGHRVRPLHWLWRTFPETFQKHIRAFALALALTIGGSSFGALALLHDTDAKPVLMPYGYLLQSPGERVKQEETRKNDRLQNQKDRFAAELMTHNIQVALTTLALGVTFGVGSTILLFYNGVTLGAVIADYARAGYGSFVAGWVLPHGIIEIPAILIAGQAAFVLGSAMVGWSNGLRLGERLRAVGPDVLTLAGGAACLLVWAGIVESFVSQYHYPVLPYSWKIAFGVLEGAVLIAYLGYVRRA
jgi:uncharacterized membrane protein SpoIIM required for sporulation